MPTIGQHTQPTIQSQLDVDAVNKALGTAGMQPIAAAPTIAPAPQTVGQGWQAGAPLVQNPVNMQNAQKAGGGSGMDWTAFAGAMGDMEGPTLPEPSYRSDLNAMKAYDRAAEDKKRRGNGAEHAGLIMSLVGSFFGMGGAGGAMGGLGGGK